MKASVFHSPKNIKLDTVDDPVIEKAGDAIIRVTSTAICGSDLHIYNGMFPQLKPLIYYGARIYGHCRRSRVGCYKA